MNRNDPPAAGVTGGSVNARMNALPPEEAFAGDEDIRRDAAARLAEQLEIGAGLLLRCEALAATAKGDKTGPLTAAARLIRANAQAAQALAALVQVERRQRSIIERIQTVAAGPDELNCKKNVPVCDEEQRLKIYRRMDALVEETLRARSGDPEAHDSIAALIAREEQELAEMRGEGWPDEDDA